MTEGRSRAGSSFRALVLAASLVFVSVGCSDDSEGDSSERPSRTTTTAQVPNPSAAVLFTYVNADPFLRFAAVISNPGSRALVGVETVWKALDANGVIVGSRDGREVAPIPPGGGVLDVGGAGGLHLTGTPASVVVEVTKTGSFVDVVPDPVVSVVGATFSRAEFDLSPGARDYDVLVTIVALTEVLTADLSVSAVLKSADGTIVGADFGDLIDLPTRLSQGEVVQVPAIISVRNGEPTTVEAAAYG